MKRIFAWRRFYLLCLAVLATLSCWGIHVGFVGQTFSQVLFMMPSAVASTPASHVQQGVRAYRDNDYTSAIEHWQAAIALYPPEETSLDHAIILENLARAYQQTGQPSVSLGYWQSTTAIYTALQNWQKVGRTLTAQAQAYSQLGQPSQSIGLLCTALHSPSEVLEGEPLECDPQSAVSLAQKTNDADAQIAALGALGEAYRTLNRYSLALQALQSGLALAEVQGNRQFQALLRNSLGNLYKEQSELSYQRAAAARRSATGREDTFYADAAENDNIALSHFEQSQTIAQQLGLPTLEVKALLGQIVVNAHSLDPYAPSAPNRDANRDTFRNSSAGGRQQRLSQLDRIERAREQARALWEQLPPTQEKVYLALQLTKQFRSLAAMANTSVASRSQCRDIVTDGPTQLLLQLAYALATTLQNNRLKAFAEGEIGHYYECEGNYPEALTWSERARLSASGDRVLALDTLYLWQWQTGRIYQALGRSASAIELYAQAVNSLNRVRAEILASDRTLQFDFRDAVAPVYRELANIQLSLASERSLASAASQPSLASKSHGQQTKAQRLAEDHSPTMSQNITAALGNIDDLQLAELQNYFGSDCIVPVAQQRLDTMLAGAANATSAEATSAESTSALVSTIIFPERTAVILTLPGQSPLLHWIEVQEHELRQWVIAFRNSLEDTANELEGYDTQLSQRLYQQMIAPFQAALQAHDLRTIVFVNDGILRNIPMSALYDGRQYLVEKYAIAIAPSLQRPIIPTATELPSKALVLGLSQNPIVDGKGLGALPAVKREVQEVVSILPESDLLLNEAFTKDNLQSRLSSQFYPVLHIATHGKFETEPNNTFLVMGGKEPGATEGNTTEGNNATENKLLRLGELDTLVRSGTVDNKLLDLIVLSACQTGSGDERSALGLAGVAIRAGADTAVASLWSVDDEATADLITYFYQNWEGGAPKAEALRQAQMTVMRDGRYLQHPAYWAAFMMVGDWQ